MDPFADFWGPPKGAGPLTMQLAGGGQLPAGMRNNNPGNIKYFAGLNYPGMTGPSQNRDEGDPQMVFDTPQNGMNAASTLALKKYSGGKRTANDLIAGNMGWTPGNTSAAANIARTMGVSPSDDLQLNDPGRMRSFLKALTFQEHGPASRMYGDDVYAGVGSGTPQPATQERAQMPMMQPPQRQPGLTSAMGGMSNSMVPGIFGGGDEPGYFGKLLSDPTFLMGASVLGSGLSGRDAGSALQQGAQGAAAVSEMTEKRRRAQAWQKMFPSGGQPDMSAPILKGVPPDLVPLIQQMGADDGMKMLGQIAMKRAFSSKEVHSAAPGSTLYDRMTGETIGQTKSESPYGKELAQEQAKADVKSGEHAKAGQQMLDLTDKITQLAGQPGTPARQTFEDSTGPLQGSDWYQTAKGFINSKAETPVVHAQLQQDLGTLKLLATRAYLSGQGQVTEAERAAVAEAIGRVEKAPSAEAGLQALNNVRGIIQQVFMKPPTGQPGAPAAPGGMAPPQMPQDVAMPGMSVQGGMPGGQPQPAPQAAPSPAGPQGGPPPTLISDGKGNMLQLDPSGSQWVPVQQPQGAPAGQPAPAAAPGPVDKGPFNAPRPNGPNVLDRWVLKAGAQRKPELIQQYNAAYGPGEAEKVLGGGTAQPAQGQGRYGYRATR